MLALAAGAESMTPHSVIGSHSEGSLRPSGQSIIKNLSHVREFQELAICLEKESEREGFPLDRFCKLFKTLVLRDNSSSDNELARLADVLFLHGFLPSRDAF